MTTKECSNCEGEGRVVIWGRCAHEVPVSRRRTHPLDYPGGDPDRCQPSYLCPICEGTGRREVE